MPFMKKGEEEKKEEKKLRKVSIAADLNYPEEQELKMFYGM